MKLLSLFSKKENAVEITGLLLSTLKVPVTITTLEKELEEHPDYPSLLSVSDVLSSYGVENIAFASSIEKLAGMPVPFVAPVKGEKGHKELLTMVLSVKGDRVHYYNPERNKWEDISKDTFQKIWPSGIVLLADAESAKGEKEYQKRHWEERRQRIEKYSAYSIY
jgi:ABC-type bacteriocin/lantibiotic exporter with double-glycine peptidase domain